MRKLGDIETRLMFYLVWWSREKCKFHTGPKPKLPQYNTQNTYVV